MKKLLPLLFLLLSALCANSQTLTIHSKINIIKDSIIRIDLHGVQFMTIAYDSVDLGLPSGRLWADQNIDRGDFSATSCYFQWGYKDKLEYNFMPPYPAYTLPAGLTILPDSLDPAKVYWGNGWRCPTNAEMKELIDNTTLTFDTVTVGNSERYAFRLTSKINGNSILLPTNNGSSGLSFSDGTNLRSYNAYYLTSDDPKKGYAFSYTIYSKNGIVESEYHEILEYDVSHLIIDKLCYVRPVK